MPALLRTPATAVWLVLILATAISWQLGIDGSPTGSHTVASIAVLLIAFVKVRLVGLWFMELKDAPLPLRTIFEVYCLAVASLVIGLYLFA